MLEVIGDTPFSNVDLKIAGYYLFKKLAAAAIYNPDRKFNGSITLIKAADNFVYLEKDYGLSKVKRRHSLFLSFSLLLTIVYCRDARHLLTKICRKVILIN